MSVGVYRGASVEPSVYQVAAQDFRALIREQEAEIAALRAEVARLERQEATSRQAPQESAPLPPPLPLPPEPPPSRFMPAGLVLLHAQRRALVDGRDMGLSRREFQVVAALAERPGVPRYAHELEVAVWGCLSSRDAGRDDGAHRFRILLGRLRRKLIVRGVNPARLIRTLGSGQGVANYLMPAGGR